MCLACVRGANSASQSALGIQDLNRKQINQSFQVLSLSLSESERILSLSGQSIKRSCQTKVSASLKLSSFDALFLVRRRQSRLYHTVHSEPSRASSHFFRSAHPISYFLPAFLFTLRFLRLDKLIIKCNKCNWISLVVQWLRIVLHWSRLIECWPPN